jgi:hypothetical protein
VETEKAPVILNEKPPLNTLDLPEMTSIGQLLNELKKRDFLKKELPVNPVTFAMEESMKKRLQRNMYKCQRVFQSLKVSMNKKLRDLGANLDGSDSATDI